MPKTLTEFQNSAVVTPVSGQHITVHGHEPATLDPNNPGDAIFKGFVDGVMGSIMNGKTEAELSAIYGPNWQAMAGALAAAVYKHTTLGPKDRPPSDGLGLTVHEASEFVQGVMTEWNSVGLMVGLAAHQYGNDIKNAASDAWDAATFKKYDTKRFAKGDHVFHMDRDGSSGKVLHSGDGSVVVKWKGASRPTSHIEDIPRLGKRLTPYSD